MLGLRLVCMESGSQWKHEMLGQNDLEDGGFMPHTSSETNKLCDLTLWHFKCFFGHFFKC